MEETIGHIIEHCIQERIVRIQSILTSHPQTRRQSDNNENSSSRKRKRAPSEKECDTTTMNSSPLTLQQQQPLDVLQALTVEEACYLLEYSCRLKDWVKHQIVSNSNTSVQLLNKVVMCCKVLQRITELSERQSLELLKLIEEHTKSRFSVCSSSRQDDGQVGQWYARFFDIVTVQLCNMHSSTIKILDQIQLVRIRYYLFQIQSTYKSLQPPATELYRSLHPHDATQYTEQLQEFESRVSQPYWETRILLRQVETLLALPPDLSGLSEKQRHELDTLLHQTSTNTDNQSNHDNQLKSLVAHKVQEALQDQCNHVLRLLESTNNSPAGIKDVADYVQQQKEALYRMQAGLPETRARLTKRITYYLKITLEILETMWSILQEFKNTHEMEKNKALDAYYSALADSLIIRTKLLYVSTLVATYDAKMVAALKTLRSILESRLIDARTQLSYAQRRLEKYQEMGPEFETLAEAYFKLLDDIQATQDDIDRIKQN